MRKIILFMLLMVATFTNGTMTTMAAETTTDSATMSNEETIAELMRTLDEYLDTRLLSLDSGTKANIVAYIDEAIRDPQYAQDVQQNPMFMRLMGLYGSLGRAHAVGEKSGYPDIINDYGKLSDADKEKVISELKLAFGGAKMGVAFENNILTLTKPDGGSIGRIAFVAEEKTVQPSTVDAASEQTKPTQVIVTAAASPPQTKTPINTVAPKPTTPVPTASEPTTPESTAPESTAPEPTAPESTTTPEPTASEPTTPEPTLVQEGIQPDATADPIAVDTSNPEPSAKSTPPRYGLIGFSSLVLVALVTFVVIKLKRNVR